MLVTVLYSLVLFSLSALSDPDPTKNPIYIITNAERPSFDRPGLSPVGTQRAEQCIPSVFANISIGAIIVCAPKAKNTGCLAANATAAPLAASLGLVPDTSCGDGENSNDDCVSNKFNKLSKTLNSTQAILVVWDGTVMDDFLENVDFDLPDDVDEDNDDLGIHSDIMLIKNVGSGSKLVAVSMNCTGIDGEVPST